MQFVKQETNKMSDIAKKPAEVIRDTVDVQLERIRTALDDRNISKVAIGTGLHENTIRNIVNGRGDMPTLATIEKLGDYLFN
jgi:riboflavin biosynthesis pyrimidine reductase